MANKMTAAQAKADAAQDALWARAAPAKPPGGAVARHVAAHAAGNSPSVKGKKGK